MNIVLNKNDYSIDDVYFKETIKNAIIENSSFIRILYSNSLIVLNGIYILIDNEEFNINKIKSTDDIFNIIYFLTNLEINILKKINIKSKTPVYKIIEYFTNKCFNKHSQCILKISGIWITSIEYGLTLTFMDI